MNRLEEHIKTKLQKREITPSEDAWRSISRELKLENPPQRNRYWWAIAAGFIGIVLVSTLIFRNQSSIENTVETVVVDEEINETGPKVNERSVQISNEASNPAQNEMAVEILSEGDKEATDELLMENGKQEQLVQNEDVTKKVPLNDMVEVTELAINTKLEEIMEQVSAMEKDAIVVTDAEIDSLLLAAQRELLTQKAVEENGKVDAMALLNEVELELYDDNRNPLFIKLKEGFFKLRTAVADRNN